MAMQNKSEEIVYRICRKSFLTLWSTPNPQGRTPKAELCDILVVCDPDVIIVSVKDVTMKDSGSFLTDLSRWYRRAIDDAVKQVYGAERWIDVGQHRHVITRHGKLGLPYPDKIVRRVHRIVIALGSLPGVPIPFGHFGKGFVHVFDGETFQHILDVLDTVTDFVNYLDDKEDY